MNIVVTFCLCIFLLNQVDAFDIVIHINRLQGNSFIPVSVNLLTDPDAPEFELVQYEIIFNRDVDKEHDMPLKFTYFTDDGRPLNAKPGSLKYTSLCEADKETIEGHTARMTARVLGLTDHQPCPIKSGTRLIQNDTFSAPYSEFHEMLFNPLGPGYDAFLTVTTEDHFLFSVFTTYDWND